MKNKIAVWLTENMFITMDCFYLVQKLERNYLSSVAVLLIFHLQYLPFLAMG